MLLTPINPHTLTTRPLVLPSEDASWLRERGVSVYSGDVREPETLTQPMRNADAVVHMAALMAPTISAVC
jgi:nucleoside-diphosphate-sugar epimerase